MWQLAEAKDRSQVTRRRGLPGITLLVAEETTFKALAIQAGHLKLRCTHSDSKGSVDYLCATPGLLHPLH